MYRDFIDLLSTLNDHGVEYLIVGGYALSFHGEPRATGDLDIFVGTDLRNVRALYQALAGFGAALGNLRPEDLSHGFFRMGRPPVMVDVLTRIDGVSFADAWPRRFIAVLDPSLGVSVNVLSREDIIANKRAAGRPQDLADVAALTGGSAGSSAE